MQKIKNKLSKKHQASDAQNNSKINHSSSVTTNNHNPPSTIVPTAQNLVVSETSTARVVPVVEPVGPYKQREEERRMLNATNNSLPIQNQVHPTHNSMGSHQVQVEPTKIERVEKPVVVIEHIHPIEKEEIQPIIHREREQVEIRQITQPTREIFVAPVQVMEGGNLASQTRETLVERSAVPLEENIVLPSRKTVPLSTQREELAPILKETIQKTIVEEVTPYVQKDVFAPRILEQTQPIYEKTASEAVYFQSTLAPVELGVVYGSKMERMEGMRGGYHADLGSRSLWEKEVTMGGSHISSHFERRVGVNRADNFIALPTLYTAPLEMNHNAMNQSHPMVHQERMMQTQNNWVQQGTRPVHHGIPMSVTAQPNGGFKQQNYQTSSGTVMGPLSAR